MSVHADLDGFHRVVLVQLVDVVGDAGVERRGGDGVDDGGVVRLLLVALAVGVDEQRDQAAQDGAAEADRDHVEEVEVWGKRREVLSVYALRNEQRLYFNHSVIITLLLWQQHNASKTTSSATKNTKKTSFLPFFQKFK